MSLPLDTDGFLRRECPNCERQFKRRLAATNQESTEEAVSPQSEVYFCPYCNEPSTSDTWWTQEQIDFAQRQMLAEVLEPELYHFKQDVESINRLNSPIQANVTIPSFPVPELLAEPNDRYNYTNW